MHPIGRLASMPAGIRKGVLALAFFLGLLNLTLVVPSILSGDPYRKDFLQEYLLGKAVLAGAYPYAALSEVAAQVVGRLPDAVEIAKHPTPHPPPNALLFLPLGLLSYAAALLTWSAVQAGCLVFAMLGIVGLPWRKGIFPATLLSLLALAWSPFLQDLALGQLMTFELALLVAGWRALEAKRPALGGALLGSALAIKLFPWPLVALLACRREWRAATAAAAVAFAANGAAACVMGIGAVADYYLKVGAQVATLYRADAANFSAWTVGWKLCAGTRSPLSHSIASPPVVATPWLAPWAALAVPAVILIAGLILALRTADDDASFAIGICVSVAISPVAWCSYLTLAAIPLAFVLKRLHRQGFPAPTTNLAIAVASILLVPPGLLSGMTASMIDPYGNPATPAVRFAAAALGTMPLAAVVALAVVASKLSTAPAKQQRPADATQ